MSKRSYVIWLFAGAFFIVLLLPIINYKNDQWRVLHQDFGHGYTDITINKIFLKTAYLIEHSNKYKMLMFGSSRNGALVESDIMPESYNAYSDFGVIGNHLHTLQTLIDQHIVPQKIWIGLNDFDIWKDPKDFMLDYSKMPYPASGKEWFSFFKLYLFKSIDNNDIAIWTHQTKLEKSNRIYRKNLDQHRKSLIERENNVIQKGVEWRRYMTQMAPTLLGYQDNEKQYRIDQCIEEVKQIVRLAQKHKIETTFFIYPTFYKTYVYYNQKKIEEFKRKLAEVTDFYDFYRLDNTAFDELKWHDTSHFLYSVGYQIEQDILHKRHLVTKKNIENVLREERYLYRSLLQKEFPILHILRMHDGIDISGILNSGVIATANGANQLPIIVVVSNPAKIVSPTPIANPIDILEF